MINDGLEKFDKLRGLLKGGEWDDKIVNYYYKHEFYLDHILKALEIVEYGEKNRGRAFNVIKTTRAGFTTNAIMANLMTGRKVLLVEPTNAIAYDTVKQIMKVYVGITGDNGKTVRAIPNNVDGCSEVVERLEENEFLKLLPFVTSGDCLGCDYGVFDAGMFLEKANVECCNVKTMMYEKEVLGDAWSPDVVTITYDKLMGLKGGYRSDFFTSMIHGVDTVIFDELGSYLSKSDAGFVVKETRVEGLVECEESLEDRVRDLEGFVESMEDEISRIKLTGLLNDYIRPWMRDTVGEALGMAKVPRYLMNSLGKELIIVTKRSRNGRVTRERMYKRDAILEQFNSMYDIMEELVGGDGNEKYVLFLIELIEVLGKKKYVVWESNGVEWGDVGEEVKVKKLNLSETTDDLIEDLEVWISEDQVTLFTDATMPAYSFDMMKKKKVIDVVFGDPIGTNRMLLLSKSLDVENFSVMRWNKDVEYKGKVVGYIKDLVDAFGGHNFVVWAPNIKIYEELMYLFGEDGMGYRVCNHESEDEYAIMFTYYNSVMTRGVECDRRIQVLVGKATKPRGSFRHVAFMQRVNWDVFDEREIRKLADKRGMGLSEYKGELEAWSGGIRHGGEMYNVNDVPEVVEEYFECYGEAIQKEKTYGDSWQAGSRAKDSLAKVRSVLICLGWRDSDVWEMVKWGGTRSIKYKIGNGEVVRTVEGQRTVIGPPNVVRLDCLDRVVDWMNGGILVPEVVGFDVDLQSGILNMLMYGDEVTSGDVWVNLSKNMGIGYGSEGSRNGYMVGAINTFMEYNEFDMYIECKDVGDGSFIFKRLTEPKEVVDKGNISTYQMELMLKVLKSAFLIGKGKVTMGDLKGRCGKLGDVEIQLAMYNIVRYDVLRGSNWEIKNKVRVKKGKKVKEFMIEKRKQKSVLGKKRSKIMIDFAGKKNEKDVLLEVLRWQEEGMELEVGVDSIGMNVEADRGIIEKVLSGFGEDGVFGKYGIACNVESDGGGMYVMRNIARV